MMFSYGKREIIFPVREQAIGFFLPVLINVEIDLRSFAIDILGDFARGVKSFRVSQVINQLSEVPGHLIRVLGGHMLVSQPPVAVLFYE
jgi:hypothetical protein